MKKHSWIKSLLMLTVCLFCFSFVALAADEGGGMGGGPGGMGGPGGGQTVTDSLPREPATTIGENMLTYDLVEQGIPYDEAGLLSYKIENGEATIMSCDPAITGELYIPDFIEGAPVTAVNDYAFLYCANMTALTLPATVTDIGDFAFCYCTALQSVTIGGAEGNGVKIGEYAFYRNYDLTTLNYGVIEEIGDYCFSYAGIPNLELKEGLKRLGSYAFSYCDNITQISLPSSLTEIGDFVFCQCTALTTASIPADMSNDTMGGYMFYGCSELTGVTLPQSWTEIPEGIFKLCEKINASNVLKEGIVKIGDEALYGTELPIGNLVIPSTVEEIGGYNFYVVNYYGRNPKNYQLTSVTLPQGLKAIGESTFSNCRGLTTVNLPDSLERIGGHAFEGVALSGKLVLGENLKEVGEYVFKDTNVTSLTVPATLTTVDDYAFAGMTALESVTIREGSLAENWGGFAFDSDTSLADVTLPSTWTVIPEGLLSKCTALTTVDLPKGITAIENNAFAESGLSAVDIPNTVEAIGDYAFGGSSSSKQDVYMGSGTKLTEVVLPSSLKTIGNNAFYQCVQLKTVTVNSAVEAIGNYAFSGCIALESIDLSQGIQRIGTDAFKGCTALKTALLGSGMTSLTSLGVFHDCTSLETVILPDTLEHLGLVPPYEGFPQEITTPFVSTALSTDGLFEGCTSLKEITLPSGLLSLGGLTFRGCTALEKLALPDGILAIGAYAVEGCSSLSEITLPASVKYVAKGAFENGGMVKVTLDEELSIEAFTYNGSEKGLDSFFGNCANLAFINIPNGWTEVPAYFVYGAGGPMDLIIPASVTKINNQAFYQCTGLRSVTILGNLEEIGASAFAGCTGLTSIRLPDSLRVIGASAFCNTGLTSFTVPPGVTEENFGEFAIGNCPNLAQFNLPSTWTRIPSGLLMNNQVLKSFTIPEGVVEIGASAFRGSTLTEIAIPSTVTTIGDWAFMDCAYLTEVNLPDSVETIGFKCFYGCDSLTEVTIPGTLSVISSLAFSDCANLETVVIQEGVETIQGYAFAFCPSLSEVTIPASVTQIGIEAFYAPKDGRLHASVVPGSVGEEYTDVVLYIGTDGNPVPAGMTFQFKEYGDIKENYLIVSPSYRWGYGYTATYNGFVYAIKVQSATLNEDGYEVGSVFNNYEMDFAATITGLTEPYTGTDLVIDDYVTGSQIPIIALGDWLFQNCTTLRTVTFGSNMVTLGNGLFSNCTNLRSVDMSRSKISAVKGFDGCISLSEVKWSPELAGFFNSAFKGCTSLTDLDFQGTSLRSVGASAFNGCTGLTSLNFQGTNLRTIDSSAFSGCTNLTSLTLVEGVDTIEDSAFNGTALTNVELPASLHVLQPSAFDPKVTLNFTGDATEVLYHYIADNGNIVYEPVLPILLERNGIRIGQFFGEGLDNQDTYFISTESVGLNVPYGLQILGAIGEVGVPVGAQLDTPEAQPQPASAEPQPQVEAPEELPLEEIEEEEPEPEPEPEEIPELKLYEVVTKAIEENPLAAVALLAAIVALIVMGGIRGYRRILR